MNAVIFARGANIEKQIEQGKAYAESKGYTIKGVIVAQGRQLPEIITGLGEDIDRVIVHCMSRISRNALENYTIQTELELDYGVLIEVASDKQRKEAEENFMRNVVMAIRENDTRERVKYRLEIFE